MHVKEINDAIKKLAERGFGLIYDDSSSYSKAVLFAPARELKESTVNEMLSISPCQVYITIGTQRRRSLELAPMSRPGILSLPRSGLPLCESVEAREGVHTGISVFDRTTTLKIIAEHEPNPKKIVKPGHVFPLEIADGGVLVKPAVFEAAADITTLSAGYEAAAVVELLDQDGNYLGADGIRTLARQNNLPLFALSSVVVYRLRTEHLVEKTAEAKLPLRSGKNLDVKTYLSKINGTEHVALSLGQNFDQGPVLTRVHQERLLSDLFGDRNAAHDSILQKSIEVIEKEGRGLIVYLRSPQQDLFQNLEEPPERGVRFREYGVGAQIIKQCGAQKIELLSHSFSVPEGLENFGLEIVSVRKL